MAVVSRGKPLQSALAGLLQGGTGYLQGVNQRAVENRKRQYDIEDREDQQAYGQSQQDRAFGQQKERQLAGFAAQKAQQERAHELTLERDANLSALEMKEMRQKAQMAIEQETQRKVDQGVWRHEENPEIGYLESVIAGMNSDYSISDEFKAQKIPELEQQLAFMRATLPDITRPTMAAEALSDNLIEKNGMTFLRDPVTGKFEQVKAQKDLEAEQNFKIEETKLKHEQEKEKVKRDEIRSQLEFARKTLSALNDDRRDELKMIDKLESKEIDPATGDLKPIPEAEKMKLRAEINARYAAKEAPYQKMLDKHLKEFIGESGQEQGAQLNPESIAELSDKFGVAPEQLEAAGSLGVKHVMANRAAKATAKSVEQIQAENVAALQGRTETSPTQNTAPQESPVKAKAAPVKSSGQKMKISDSKSPEVKRFVSWLKSKGLEADELSDVEAARAWEAFKKADAEEKALEPTVLLGKS